MDGPFWTSRRHWWEQVNNTLIEFHPSMTSRSSRERTRAARLIDRDSNDFAISPPPRTEYTEYMVNGGHKNFSQTECGLTLHKTYLLLVHRSMELRIAHAVVLEQLKLNIHSNTRIQLYKNFMMTNFTMVQRVWRKTISTISRCRPTSLHLVSIKVTLLCGLRTSYWWNIDKDEDLDIIDKCSRN